MVGIVSNIEYDNYSSVNKLSKLSISLFLYYKLLSVLLLYLESLILHSPDNLPMCIMTITVNSFVRERKTEPMCRLITGYSPFFTFQQILKKHAKNPDLTQQKGRIHVQSKLAWLQQT